MTQEAAYFGLPLIGYDVGELQLFTAAGGRVLVNVGDEVALERAITIALTDASCLPAMREAAAAYARELRYQLRASPSIEAAVDQFEKLLLTAMRRASSSSEVAAAPLPAPFGGDMPPRPWAPFLRRLRLPIAMVLGVQLYLLVLARIPSEASAIDRAVGDAPRAAAHDDAHDAAADAAHAAAHATFHSAERTLAILTSSLPPLLAFGTPLLACLTMRLPLPLTRQPPPGATYALAALAAATLLSVHATWTLRQHLALGALGAAAPCADGLFGWSRNPICVCTCVLAGCAARWRLMAADGA